MKRIGIIIGNTKPFSSGLTQNAYFLYKIFTNMGHTCKFLTYYDSYTFDYNEIPVTKITHATELFTLDVIISVLHGIKADIYDMCKKRNISVIGFLCGNALCLDNEVFLKSDGDIICSETPADLFWVINSFEYMKSYIEVKRKAPVKIVPHLWSPIFIENYMKIAKKEISDLIYTPRTHTKKQIDIVIVEPNINFVKTALVPLMVAEKIHTLNPELINEVFIFNFPTHSKSAVSILDRLSVGKKVRKFKGIVIPEILLFFNARNSIPIFISHQFYTPLNYLYYELMYFGYPLIHNSVLLKDYCYYYNDCNVDECANQALKAYETYNSNMLTEIQHCRKYLENIDPSTSRCVESWKSILEPAALP
jgi:hypothetical protein